MKRRQFLVAGGVVAAGLWWLRPSDAGAGYQPYFSSMNQTLRRAGIAGPRLLIDLDRVDQNIAQLTASIRRPKVWRVVVKSLPSVPLLRYILDRAHTKSLMVFHQPFLSRVAQDMPDTDVLMGKPMPVDAAARFYESLLPGGFEPSRQLQWLIDSDARLLQYQGLARRLGVRMRINLELDVGLHRGGFADVGTVVAALGRIVSDPVHFEFSGFMGYEPFLAKLPRLQHNLSRVKARYREFVGAARATHPDLFSRPLTYNTAGSLTYSLYEDDDLCNDISAGSGVVMPTDFDIPRLARHQPASFIATPVLKVSGSVRVPGLEFAAPLFSLWNPNRRQAFYLYGGNWQAEYESPPGLVRNPIWGHSSNQEMVNASGNVPLQVDDFVFLRPRQSEAVFLQFGDILVIRNGQLADNWPVFATG